MARKTDPGIESYVVVKKIIGNDEHRAREVHISLPRIAWMGERYYEARQREAAPAPVPEDGRKNRGAFRKSR